MIAEQRNQIGVGLQLEQLFDDASAIGAAVNVVTHENERVLWGWLDLLDNRPECFATAVDIADRDRSSSGHRLLGDVIMLQIVKSAARTAQ